MPYKRQYRKRQYKRRPKRMVTRPVVRRIVKQQLDKQIENKVRFINDPAASLSSTIYVTALTSGLTQGTAANTRVGDAVHYKRISGRVTFYNNLTYPIFVRMIVLKIVSAAYTPIVTDLFFYNGTAGYEIVSPINYPEASGKYRVIKDRTFSIGEANEFEQQKLIRFSIKCNGVTKWDRSGNAGTGHYAVCWITDNANPISANISYYTSFEDA